MSTYVYLMCMDHDPPLEAREESAQHAFDADFAAIRDDLAHREYVVRCALKGDYPSEYFRARTVRFLTEHATCRISICDENGNWYDPQGEGSDPCAHPSWSGTDARGLDDPEKVWECDTCLFRFKGDPDALVDPQLAKVAGQSEPA
jgi:hypothetical protein